MGQSAVHKKQVTQSTEFNFESKMFHQMIIFSYLKLWIQHPGDINFFDKAVILSSTHNFFATIAALCNNYARPLQVKNTTIIYICFLPPSHTVTDLSGNTCFLQQVQKVMSLGC